jgi:hypothetical protein
MPHWAHHRFYDAPSWPQFPRGRVTVFAVAANENTPSGGATPTIGDAADHVTSIVHVFPDRTTDNFTLTYGGACPRAGRRPDPGDPAGREVSKSVDNGAYAYSPPATGTTAYGAANALNQYPTVGGYAYTY